MFVVGRTLPLMVALTLGLGASCSGTVISCPGESCTSATGGGAGGGTGGGEPGIDTGSCTPCALDSDCATGSSCLQFAGSDFCSVRCGTTGAACQAGESCLPLTADDGTAVLGCVPNSGTCGVVGCGTCPQGTACDVVLGDCVETQAPHDGGCDDYDAPTTASCCQACATGANCQDNGCGGGQWCQNVSCACQAAPTDCVDPADAGAGGGAGGGGGTGGGSGGGTGGGTGGAGGGAADAGRPVNHVGPDGGAVNSLLFAIVGDTRPAGSDQTAHYPKAIITKIYQDIEAHRPKVQFVVGTGDYQFASGSGPEGPIQIGYYLAARNNYSGTVFASMGNHECGTGGNCPNAASHNLTAYMNKLVLPLGHAVPYYSFRVNDTGGQWTSKFIITACNWWTTAQRNWLTAELAKPTTYTFIVRHHPLGSDGPCNAQMDPMLDSAKYNGLLVGHVHTVAFSSAKKQLVEGVGGAPINSTANYGYAIVAQQPSGHFKITQYDYQTNLAVSTYTLQ